MIFVSIRELLYAVPPAVVHQPLFTSMFTKGVHQRRSPLRSAGTFAIGRLSLDTHTLIFYRCENFMFDHSQTNTLQ